MNIKEFNNLFNNQIVILDGGMGTMLQSAGMPNGVCPENWAMQNSELLVNIQKAYVEAGANIIYTFTFGANPIKLSEYNLSTKTYEINKELAKISLEAASTASNSCFVAGDISSCGSLLQPYGEILFEDAVNCFKEQVKGLLNGGVDLFVIETMMDIQEARAALIAVKELCPDKPVMVSLTYDGNRTLMGTDPLSALVTLQSLGADAVGCNCSSGPAEMIDLIKIMKPYAKVPLIAKPNAGMPHLENTITVFDMDANGFASYTEDLINAGVNAIGGCCGTTPEYIRNLSKIASNFNPIKITRNKTSLACSNRKTVEIGENLPFTVIGERLNPTGKKALKEAIKSGDMDFIAKLAREQVDAGAALLDVNAGVPGVDEREILVNMINAVNSAVAAPILIDTSDYQALAAALRIYPGRAIINSISGESEKLEKILPLAKKYGSMFVLLPVDDTGVPETATERIKIIERVYEKAEKLGFSKEDILVDGLVMTIASNSNSAVEALGVISWCKKSYGFNTTLGLSNVSFGLPSREAINSTFLAMAVSYGLSTAIMNPNTQQLMQIVKASDALVGRDTNGLSYTGLYAQQTATENITNNKTSKSNIITLYEAIVNGEASVARTLAEQQIKNSLSPQAIIDDELIPAIQKVGELYEEKKYFLPQLIRGAEAMEAAMSVLTPEIEKEEHKPESNLGTIVIATVKGDVHDIGKNIVSMLFKNYGFNVIDLGKDVDAKCIIDAARSNNADIIALSALMTTTMNQMLLVMSTMKEAGLNCDIMVGGAVVDSNFAKSFGAHYSSDAYKAVKLAKELVNKRKSGDE